VRFCKQDHPTVVLLEMTAGRSRCQVQHGIARCTSASCIDIKVRLCRTLMSIHEALERASSEARSADAVRRAEHTAIERRALERHHISFLVSEHCSAHDSASLPARSRNPARRVRCGALHGDCAAPCTVACVTAATDAALYCTYASAGVRAMGPSVPSP